MLQPPLPLPENLWGDHWRFASVAAADLVDLFLDRAIPCGEFPSDRFPLTLGLASTLPIPGLVITAGRRALTLARWIQDQKPTSIHYQSGPPGGVLLHTHTGARHVLVTFEDSQVQAEGQRFEDRVSSALGLHFILIQPDESGQTYSGLWLLRRSGHASAHN